MKSTLLLAFLLSTVLFTNAVGGQNPSSIDCKTYIMNAIQIANEDTVYLYLNKVLNKNSITSDTKCELNLLSIYTTISLHRNDIDTLLKYQEVINSHDSIDSYPNLRLTANHNLGGYYINNRRDSAGLMFFDKIISESSTCKDSFTYLVDLSNIYTNNKTYQKSLEILMTADELRKRCTVHPNSESEAISSLSSVYFNIGDYRNSLKYRKEAISKRTKQNEFVLLDDYYMAFEAAFELKDSTECERFLDSMLIHRKIHGTRGIALFDYASGRYFLLKKDYVSAKKYLSNSYSYYKDINEPFMQHNVGSNLIFSMSMSGETEKTSSYVDDLIECCNENKSTFDSLNLDIYKYLASYASYDKRGANEAAIVFQKFTDYYEENSRAEIKEIEAKWQNEKKQLENDKLTKENALQSLKLQQRNMLLSIGGLSLLILSFLLFRLYKSNKDIQSKNRKIATLNSEITHRVKNQFVLATELLKRQRTKAQSAEIKSISEESENHLRAIASVNKRLQATNDYKEVNMSEVLTEIIENLHFSYNTINGHEIKLVKDYDNVVTDQTKATYLGLILNELYTNSFKHAFENINHPEIHSSLKAIGDSLVFEYFDNGNKKEATDKNTSKGSSLISSLTAQLGAKLIQMDANNMHYKIEFNGK